MDEVDDDADSKVEQRKAVPRHTAGCGCFKQNSTGNMDGVK